MQQLQVASVNIQYTCITRIYQNVLVEVDVFYPIKRLGFLAWGQPQTAAQMQVLFSSTEGSISKSLLQEPPMGGFHDSSLGCRLTLGWLGLGGQNAVYGPPVLNRAEMQFTQVRNAGLQSRIHPQQGKIIWQQPAMCWDRTGFLMKLLGNPLMGRFKPTKHVQTRHQNGGIL